MHGGDWTPIYSDAWSLGHRRVIYTTNGVEHVPGRFAIDWMKVAPDGTHAKGDEANPANWYGYGADVLAVADATVSVAMDDIPDPQTVEPQKVIEIQNASGNFSPRQILKYLSELSVGAIQGSVKPNGVLSMAGRGPR